MNVITRSKKHNLGRFRRVSNAFNRNHKAEVSDAETDKESDELLTCQKPFLSTNCDELLIELKASNICQINEDLIVYIYDFLSFSDLVAIKGLGNKYLSCHVLEKYKEQAANYCTDRWLPLRNKVLKPIPVTLPSPKQSNDDALKGPPPNKRRRLMPQIEPKLLQVSKDFAIYVDYESALNGFLRSDIYIHDVSTMISLGTISFKDCKITTVVLNNDFIIAAGENLGPSKNKNNANKGGNGAIKVWKIRKNKQTGFEYAKVTELCISALIKVIQMDVNEKMLVFLTETDHLCFWSIPKRKDRCFCAHKLDIRNDALSMSTNHVFIGSPAQLHVMAMDDIIDWKDDDKNVNAEALKNRMCMTVNSDLKIMPNEERGYGKYSESRKKRTWANWSNQRVIEQIVSMDGGVAYFIEGKSEFTLIRINDEFALLCDFKAIGALDKDIYEYIEANADADFPGNVKGARLSIKINVEHKSSSIWIKELQCFENLILVKDSLGNIHFYTNFGVFLRMISIYDELEKLDTNVSYEDFDFAFEGMKLWISMDRKLYVLPFEKTEK